MESVFGRLSLRLVSADSLLSSSIGEEGEICTQSEAALSEIDIDHVTCSLKQISRYRRTVKDNVNHRMLQNEAVVECSPPKDELDKGNKWRLKARIRVTAASETVLEESVTFDCRNCVYRISLDALDGLEGQMTVSFTQAYALCISPLVDLQEKTELRDFPIIVEGITFYENKGFLASMSPVFQVTFYGDFSEKDKDSLELTDMSATQFEQFVQALHGSLTISKRNVENILVLADRFGVESLRGRCSDLLIRVSQRSPIKDYVGFFERLQMADKWKLGKLQAHLVEKMDRPRLSALNEDKIRLFEADTCQLLLSQAVKHLTK